MKKLIIIGNGFDLAHDKKTSYISFLFNYIENIKNALLQHFQYEDRLINVRLEDKNIDIIKDLEIEAIYKLLKSNKERKEKTIMLDVVNRNEYIIDINFNSLFFEKIFYRMELKWVDIENEYFDSIVENIDNNDNLKNINEDLYYIKEKLIMYLKNEEIREFKIKEEYVKYFLEDNPKMILFLNFNYTNTIEKYIERIENDISKVEIDYIHGSLNNVHGNPIFGIGDEHHKKYEKLKDHNNYPIAVRNSKSILYLMNNNYRELDNFIKDNYQVEIYGHSCGLSDRTLLKYIFQNVNCSKIRVFHYREEYDYIDKVSEISRHFDNSQLFRDKVERYYKGYSMNIKN